MCNEHCILNTYFKFQIYISYEKSKDQSLVIYFELLSLVYVCLFNTFQVLIATKEGGFASNFTPGQGGPKAYKDWF